MNDNHERQQSDETQLAQRSVENHSLDSEQLEVGGVIIQLKTTGARFAWSADRSELRVNTTLFHDQNEAIGVAIREVAYQTGVQKALQVDPQQVLRALRTKADWKKIFRWQGLTALKQSSPDLAQRMSATASHTLAQEFEWAIEQYLLTKQFPTSLSPAVQQALRQLPVSKGQNVLDYLSSGRLRPQDSGRNFAQYIQPVFDQFMAADQQSGQSQQFEYRPAQTKDVSAAKEPIREGDIIVKVEPFYGGYYPEQFCRYDAQRQQIVQEAGQKQTWNISEPPEDEEVWRTRRTYQGIFNSQKENIVKLPYNALLLVSTLQPPNQLQFMRSELGVITVELNKSVTEVRPTEPASFSFDFLIYPDSSNRLDRQPEAIDFQPTGGNLDAETTEFLADLQRQTGMADTQKAREVVRYIRKKFHYPKDEQEIAEIDRLYLSAGDRLWLEIAQKKVVHCYWANIFRDELCRRLGIASRIPTGPYVANKDPRFSFAIVEAPGVSKHAWGEVWDGQQWEHHGMDATPAKEKTEDGDQDQPEDSEPLDGDFGDNSEQQEDLTAEEIEQLYQDLLDQSSQNPPKEVTLEQRAVQQFVQEKGVSLSEWQRVEKWINQVNQTPVPANMSVDHRPSTLYQEWRKLFDLIYKRREIPSTVFRGPVRQSEGDLLDDPVMSFIDLKSHDDDPLGYQREQRRTKEQIEVSAFEDDWTLDMSGSMTGLAAQEQKKMVLSSLYDIRGLNDRLNHSRYKSRMSTPINIKSRVALWGDWTRVAHTGSEITEKDLCDLYKTLDQINSGSSGLHTSLQEYRDSLDPKTLAEIKAGKRVKVLTVVSDGAVSQKPECIQIIQELRQLGIIVQGIGYGDAAQDIRVVCHDQSDPEAAVVISDVRQATLVRHKLLMKHVAKL